MTRCHCENIDLGRLHPLISADLGEGLRVGFRREIPPEQFRPVYRDGRNRH